MKNKTYDGALAALCIFLYLAVGSGIAALCLLNNATTLLGFPLKYVLAVICGVFFTVYVTILIVCLAKKHGKNMLGLSFTIVFAGTLILALAPLAFILWIFQKIIESIVEKRSKSTQSKNIT